MVNFNTLFFTLLRARLLEDTVLWTFPQAPFGIKLNRLEPPSIPLLRSALEEEMSSLRIDLEHREHELRSEASRAEAEVKSVRGRLAKADEMLLSSRQECLELAEVRAALERELNLAREGPGGQCSGIANGLGEHCTAV